MSKVMKDLAKFNALKLMATQLKHQCSAHDTFCELDGVTEELKDDIDKEISKAVASLEVRAGKLNSKYQGKLVDIVGISQS
ncbi:hypothetical protein NVP1247A_70 [Vibrio phage 1.247.A._10N.261.54.E12]|nr:hypothetical protein NVP1247A_70 [Vibrio phage 1.247.A._10N.261.54.E12]AUR98214.1 hypothetical protein NVP1247B_70 [Vibrio phage 1.247.B._10N.261.54.E12]